MVEGGRGRMLLRRWALAVAVGAVLAAVFVLIGTSMHAGNTAVSRDALDRAVDRRGVDRTEAAVREPELGGNSSAQSSPDCSSDRLSLAMPARVVVVGDIHGSFSALRDVLKTTGLAESSNLGPPEWIGGSDVLVQMGDIVDRVRHDRKCLDLLRVLQQDAREKGGCAHFLLGNHELNNLSLDFSSSSRFGLEAYDDFKEDPIPAPHVSQEVAQHIAGLYAVVDPVFHSRARAFAPGGRMALHLAETRRAALILGSVLFVHAGINRHGTLSALDALNAGLKAWMRGKQFLPLESEDLINAVFFSRELGHDVSTESCIELREVLRSMNVTTVVVGHTVQVGGISSACDKTLWRIDIGMMNRQALQGVVQALEITQVAGKLSFRVIKGSSFLQDSSDGGKQNP